MFRDQGKLGMEESVIREGLQLVLANRLSRAGTMAKRGIIDEAKYLLADAQDVLEVMERRGN